MGKAWCLLMSIKVMLADDHALIREGIRQLLESDENIKVIAEAGDGDECLKKLIVYKPHILLLDINMPKKSGIEVLEIIRNSNIDVRVLILTVHDEIEYLIKVIDIGVDGYILKNSEFSELKKAILSIVDGENYIQKKLIPVLNKRLGARKEDKIKLDSLTNREMEILLRVANGMYNKEIATSLNISERTVKNHLTNIFKKIEVIDRTQAAVFAIKNDIIKLI